MPDRYAVVADIHRSRMVAVAEPGHLTRVAQTSATSAASEVRALYRIAVFQPMMQRLLPGQHASPKTTWS